MPDWVRKGVGREGSLRKGRVVEGLRRGCDVPKARDERLRQGRGGPTEEGPSRPARRKERVLGREVARS